MAKGVREVNAAARRAERPALPGNKAITKHNKQMNEDELRRNRLIRDAEDRADKGKDALSFTEKALLSDEDRRLKWDAHERRTADNKRRSP